MSLPLWCLFFSAILIFLARIPVGRAMKAAGGYNNHQPRTQQAELTGVGARALAAHQNSFEAFSLFAAGVLVAEVTHTQGWLVDTIALVFLLARVIFILCYLADKPAPRSAAWTVGLLCSLLLMLSPALR